MNSIHPNLPILVDPSHPGRQQQGQEVQGAPGPAPSAVLAGKLSVEMPGKAHGKHHAPSTRFDSARFATIEKDATGSLTAQVGLGTDMAGVVRADPQGQLTFEEHVVGLHSGQPHPLSRADQASLATSLKTHLASGEGHTDPLWGALLADAQK